MTAIIDETPRVRLAKPEDEEEIFQICKLLHSENALFPMSEPKVREMLRTCLYQKGGIIGVVGEPGDIQAVICLTLRSLWYTEEWCLDEHFNYVLPNHRRSENAKELIIFAKACAQELKLPLMIGILSNERTEAKVRLYKRQLGAPSGAYFIIGAKSGHAHNHEAIS